MFNSHHSIYVYDQDIAFYDTAFYGVAYSKEYDYYICKFLEKGIELYSHFKVDDNSDFLNIKKILFDETGKIFLMIRSNDTTDIVELK